MNFFGSPDTGTLISKDKFFPVSLFFELGVPCPLFRIAFFCLISCNMSCESEDKSRAKLMTTILHLASSPIAHFQLWSRTTQINVNGQVPTEIYLYYLYRPTVVDLIRWTTSINLTISGGYLSCLVPAV